MNGGPAQPVVLLDVDNTLLDNDRVQADLGDEIEKVAGPDARRQYWAHYEALRGQLEVADYLGALRRLAPLRLEGRQLDHLIAFLMDYPFNERVYAGALDAIRYLDTWAQPVILSDGEPAYQSNKVRRAGLWDAVGGRVLIYVHKEQMQDDIDRLYPSPRHAMVDDKLRILAAMKANRGGRLVTVFVRQGHYAQDPGTLAAYPAADVSIERIGDLGRCGLRARLEGP